MSGTINPIVGLLPCRSRRDRRSRKRCPPREPSATHTIVLAEAINNLYKTELIRQQGPWRTVKPVKLATLEYVWWWNNQRLHGELDMRTPLEVEQAYCADLEPAQPDFAGPGSQ